MTTPRAWPTAKAVRTFWPKYSSSSATASGSCSASSASTSAWIVGQPPLVREARRASRSRRRRAPPARPSRARDHAVAGVGQAGVDAEDDHAGVILRPAPDACLPALARPRRWRTLTARLMSAEPIDFAAEGLLDGLEGSQRDRARSRCWRSWPPTACRWPSCAARTDGGNDHVPAGRPRDRQRASATRPREIAELTRDRARVPERARRAMGLPIPSPTSPSTPRPSSNRRARLHVARARRACPTRRAARSDARARPQPLAGRRERCARCR